MLLEIKTCNIILNTLLMQTLTFVTLFSVLYEASELLCHQLSVFEALAFRLALC